MNRASTAAILAWLALGVAPSALALPPDGAPCEPSAFVFAIHDGDRFGDAASQRRALSAGIEAFLDALGPGHEVGLVRYGLGNETLVAPRANAPDLREELLAEVQAMRFRDPWNDVYAGLDQAYRWARLDAERRGVVILIGDGAVRMPDPDRPGSRDESPRALEQQLQQIRGRLDDLMDEGLAVHTVAPAARHTEGGLMQEIARASGGTYNVGEIATLPDIIRSLPRAVCAPDPGEDHGAAGEPGASGGDTPEAPSSAPPSPRAAAPASPVHAAGAAGVSSAVPGGGLAPVLWLALAAGGLGLLGAGVVAARRRRRPAAAAAVEHDLDDEDEPAPTWDGVGEEPEPIRREPRGRPERADRRRPAPGSPEGFFSKARGTMTMAAIPDLPPREPEGDAGGLHPSEVAREGRGGPPSGRGTPRAGAPAPAPAPAPPARGGAGRSRGGPPPAPPVHQHMVQVVGYTTGGNVIKSVDMRNGGDTVVVVGTEAGAILDVPRQAGHVRGTVRLTVAPDGTRIVRIDDLPPGGFRNRDTGRALRDGDRITNNLRFEWAREERGRYLEVIIK